MQTGLLAYCRVILSWAFVGVWGLFTHIVWLVEYWGNCMIAQFVKKSTGRNDVGHITFTWETAHVDVMKWKHFPRYWSFLCVCGGGGGGGGGGIHWPPVDSQTNGWANNRDIGNFRRHSTHYDITVMLCRQINTLFCCMLLSSGYIRVQG